MLRSESATHSHSPSPRPPTDLTEEAMLDAIATEKLKSNSRTHICVRLQPLTPGLAQFVEETSKECDFMVRMVEDEAGTTTDELFNR